jgi:hypothetical protein
MAPTLPSDFSVQSFSLSRTQSKLRTQNFLRNKICNFTFVLLHYPEYVCHGSWTENDTTFIIARHAGTKHGVCISFKPSTTDSTAAQLIVGDSCYRETLSSEIPEHHLISNVTGIVREYFSIAAERPCWRTFLIKSLDTKQSTRTDMTVFTGICYILE